MEKTPSTISVLNRQCISPAFMAEKDKIYFAIDNFDRLGYKVGKGRRNMVKHIHVDGLSLNIKSFKLPNMANKFAYRFFRKSKARRSYEYAMKLLAYGIDTPQPVAYMEQQRRFTFGRSFYLSLHLDEDLTFRTLIENANFPDREEIIRQFTRFTHRIHEAGILFLDHSPGNTLIKKEKEGQYRFYLVDLNRMKHNRRLSFTGRMKNFARLTATQDMIGIISDEYARITGYDFDRVFRYISRYTAANHDRRRRQKRMNRKLGRYRG